MKVFSLKLLVVCWMASSPMWPAPLEESKAASAETPRLEKASAKIEVPPEYRGAGLPLESIDTQAALRRAEEHFQAEEWARGLALLDEVLARTTAQQPSVKFKSASPGKDEAPAPAETGDIVIFDGGDEGGETPAGEEDEPQVEPGEELGSQDAILYVPVATLVRRRCLELPPEARDLARRTYEPPAREALQKSQGLSSGKSLRELRRIGERYPLTAAGAEAWSLLGDRLLGLARAAEAARALELGLELSAEPGASATLLARIATCRWMAGSPRRARRALDEVESRFPDVPVSVRGEAVLGKDLKSHPLFKDLLPSLKPAPGTAAGGAADAKLSPWVHFKGTFDHAVAPLKGDSLPPLGSRAQWIRPLGPLESATPAEGAEDVEEARGPAQPAPYGVSLGDRVFYRRGGDVVALSARSGKLLWTASIDGLASKGAPAGASLAAGDPFGSNVGLSLSICRGAASGGPDLVVGIDRSPRAGQSRKGSLATVSNLLVALDARTGKLAWIVGHERDPRHPARGLCYTAPPAVSGELLVAPALRGEGSYAVGITSKGKVAWVRRLYSYSSAYYQRYGNYALGGTPLAAADGYAVASNGQGLVGALEASTGEILWCSRYRSQLRRAYGGMARVGQAALPIITGGAVVVLPSDSDYLTVFDLRGGNVLWEKQLGLEGHDQLVGADTERVYLVGRKVKALSLAGGRDLWESEDIGPIQGPVLVFDDRILVPSSDGAAVIESATGKVISKLRISDPRVGRLGNFHLFFADGRSLVATSKRLFELEPQGRSWEQVASLEARSPLARVRLLQAEGRFEEALAELEKLRARIKSKNLLEQVEKEIVSTARSAAAFTGDHKFLTDLLVREKPLVKERREVLAIRLAEAKLLTDSKLKEVSPATLARARDIYLELSRLDGHTALSPEGFEVDVATYASDALRDLRARGVAVEDPAGEERARALLAEVGARQRKEDVSRAAARLILRRPHLSLVADLEKELAARLEAEGDIPGALEITELSREDFPGSGAERDFEEKARAAEEMLPGSEGGAENVTEGLSELVDARGKKALGKLWWAPGEEGFLVAAAPGSEPSEHLLAISRSKLRFYGKDGRLLHERELRDYPDVSEIKTSLQAHIEEPALGRWKGGELLLFTPAGFYSFHAPGPKAEGGAARPKDVKLRWIRSLSHPLLQIQTRSQLAMWGGGMDLPADQNFFPEMVFDSQGVPVTVLPDGTLFALDLKTGKYSWRLEGDSGRAASPPFIRGPWVGLETNAPAGIRLHRPPGARRPSSPGSTGISRFIAGPEGGALSAAVLAGGLAAVFSGAALEVREAESGRALWRREQGALTLAGTTATEVWLSYPEGRLAAHSIRSGRERRSVDLPRGTMVVDKFQDPGKGDPATILVVSRSYALARGYRYSRTQTGTDLFLVRLDSRWQKTWEKQVAKGAVTFAGGRHLLKDGRFVLLYNAELEPEKWYTRALIVDPSSGAYEELASVEVESKGTGQAPRLAVLEEGLALGNADGFGWFAPKADPEPKGNSPEARDDKNKEAEY